MRIWIAIILLFFTTQMFGQVCETYCTNDQVNLSANFAGGDTYSWVCTNGYTSDQENPTTVATGAVGSVICTLTVFRDGCNHTGTVEFMIDSSSIVSLSLICEVFIDDDLDNIHNSLDNCPLQFNPDQSDVDGDGIGDACDPDSDDDCYYDIVDCAPLDPNIYPFAPCDDGDSLTVNDHYDIDCICVGGDTDYDLDGYGAPRDCFPYDSSKFEVVFDVPCDVCDDVSCGAVIGGAGSYLMKTLSDTSTQNQSLTFKIKHNNSGFLWPITYETFENGTPTNRGIIGSVADTFSLFTGDVYVGTTAIRFHMAGLPPENIFQIDCITDTDCSN